DNPKIYNSLRDSAEDLGVYFTPQSQPNLGIHAWLWSQIDRVRAWFGRAPLSLETQARNAFWVEQLPYLVVTLINILPFVFQFHSLSLLVGSLSSWLLLNGFFGAGHTQLYQWNQQKSRVIARGQSSWRQ